MKTLRMRYADEFLINSCKHVVLFARLKSQAALVSLTWQTWIRKSMCRNWSKGSKERTGFQTTDNHDFFQTTSKQIVHLPSPVNLTKKQIFFGKRIKGFTLCFERCQIALWIACISPSYAKNNSSSLQNSEFVTKSISELLDKNCSEKVASMPYCWNSLTVAGSKDKLRLVLDLRHVTEYLDFPKLKYGDLRTAWQYFEKDAYFIAFDLKSVFTKLIRTLVKKKNGAVKE